MMTVVSRPSRPCRRRVFRPLSVASTAAIFASLVALGGRGSVVVVLSLLCDTKKYLFNFDFDVSTNNKPRVQLLLCFYWLRQPVSGAAGTCTPLVAATSTTHATPPHPPSPCAMASSPFSPQSPALQDFCEKILER